MRFSFHKMHGLGNDFVIIDTRSDAVPPDFSLSPTDIQKISNRKRGVGCDQLILMERPQHKDADVFMRIMNCNGTEAEACGNATRCVARLVMEETGVTACTVETVAGLLKCEAVDFEKSRAGLAGGGAQIVTRPGLAQGGGPEIVKVNMGTPKLEWNEIPLAEEADTYGLGFNVGPLFLPCAVNIGNPHAVFFVDNAEDVDLEKWGPEVETHKMFPEKTNVEVAHIIDRHTIRMRVWERGVGITDACGSAACATMVAAVRRDLTAREAIVELDGGALSFHWDEGTGHLFMTGPTEYVFKGEMEL